MNRQERRVRARHMPQLRELAEAVGFTVLEAVAGLPLLCYACGRRLDQVEPVSVSVQGGHGDGRELVLWATCCVVAPR